MAAAWRCITYHPATAIVLLLLLGASCAWAEEEPYVRKPASPPLPLSHPLLSRPLASSNAASSAHLPEQVHLSFAGPGAYAVSWVTHPHEDPDLRRRTEAALATPSTSTPLSPAAGTAAAGTAAAAAAATEAAGRRQPLLSSSSSRSSSGGSSSSSGTPAVPATGLQTPEDPRRLRALGRHRKHDACKRMGALGLRSLVRYGFQPGQYMHEVQGHFKCYSTEEYQSGALHHAVMGDGAEGPLPADTQVYYTVGDPQLGLSQEFSFRTAPEVGAASLPYKLGVVGDLGQTEDSVSTLEHMAASSPQSMLMVGDLSYADGFQPRWDAWSRMMQPHAASAVWMYTEGNHEREMTNGVKDWVAYTTRFFIPHKHSGSASPLYYSYEVAGLHIIMLGSYVDYSEGSEQFEWLERDLAAVDRQRTPWVLAAMHAPWYSSNKNHYGEGEDMRLAMEELFYQHGVDLVLAGHVHAYERSERVFDGERDECGPAYINIGDGGNTEGGLDRKYFKRPRWSAYRESSYGHAVFEAINATHAEWRWYRNQDDLGVVSDSVVLVRNPGCKAPLLGQQGTQAQQEQQRRPEQQAQQVQAGAELARFARQWAERAGGLLSALASE